MLGEAVERLYGGHLCYGPPIEGGFYYDTFMPGSQTKDAATGEASETSVVSTGQFSSIEGLVKTISNERQTFERLELTKAELLEMFAYNPFKVRILNEKVKDEKTTVYRNGTLIDLCRGPHVRHTGCVKAFKVTKVSIATRAP